MTTNPTLFPEITTRAERRALKRDPTPALQILSMGAGVQGTTICLLIAEGRLPKPDYAIFADTGWEPAKVYDHLDRFEREVLNPIGLPLLRVSDGNIADDVIDVQHVSRLPLYVRHQDGRPGGLTERRCTGFYKVAPVQRKMRELLGAKTRTHQCKKCDGTGQRVAPWLQRFGYDDAATVGVCSVCRGTGTVTRVGPPPTGAWVNNWIGFSTDEIERVSDSRVPYTVSHYPLLQDDIMFSRDDCLAYLAEHGWGDTVKSACVGCPFHDNAAWRDVRDNDPEGWAHAVEIDAALRERQGINMPGLHGNAYLHPDRVPLPLADLSRDPKGRNRRAAPPTAAAPKTPSKCPHYSTTSTEHCSDGHHHTPLLGVAGWARDPPR